MAHLAHLNQSITTAPAPAPAPPARGFRGFRSPNYTPVPDELFDELLSTLSGAEVKVLLYIVRRTFGFKKQKERISLSQIRSGITTRDGRVLDRGTGLSLSATQGAIKGLVAKGVITAQRNRSAERGDQATTYSLHMHDQQDDAAGMESRENREGEDRAEESAATRSRGEGEARQGPGHVRAPVSNAPATGNRHGGIPAAGTARYRLSATQETGPQQTDASVRNSRAQRQGEAERDDDDAAGTAAVAVARAGIADVARPASPRPHSGILRSLAEVLAARQPYATATAQGPSRSSRAPRGSDAQPGVAPAGPSASPRTRHGRIRPTPQLAVAVTEVAQEFGDLRHLAANCTQAMRLWEASGRSESSVVGALYEARAITRQQPRVANRMSYFWVVVRDLLQLLDAPAATHRVTAEG